MKRLIPLLMICCASAQAVAQQGTLLISELLYQPSSHEAEYIELYNNSNTDINLSDYHIVRWIGDSLGKHYSLPLYTIAPHDYVALTKNATSVSSCFNVKYPSKLIECQLPTYPNGGGSVIVSTSDSVIVDRFDYLPSMHSRLLRNKAGVALERHYFDRPTNEASNWFSASSTSGHGTPGYTNSQSTEFLVEENSFTFSSTLISPNGDNYQDELEINYLLDTTDLSARLDIYDARGLSVRKLLNNDLLGTHGTITWDGRDKNGNLLPQGQYVILITLYGLDGTRQTIKRTIALLTY